jgi:hypothetical protein
VTGAAVSATGFAIVAAVGVALEVIARRGGRVAPVGGAVAAAMRTAPGRAAVLVWWLWLGIHFLAR